MSYGSEIKGEGDKNNKEEDKIIIKRTNKKIYQEMPEKRMN